MSKKSYVFGRDVTEPYFKQLFYGELKAMDDFLRKHFPDILNCIYVNGLRTVHIVGNQLEIIVLMVED